jgi:uncharacterized membrane protein YccC
MYAYQDYEMLHKGLDHTGLPNKFYGLILELASGLEYIGISVQMGIPVKKDIDLTARLADLQQLTDEAGHVTKEPGEQEGLDALKKILVNIQDISNRLNKLVLYTRMGVEAGTTFETARKVSRLAATQPVSLRFLRENLTMKSDTFRHALRLTVAMTLAYFISLLLPLSHSYWVLLTLVTILKPAYAISRKRNIQRVAGTLVGVVVASLVLYFVTNTSLLMSILIMSMLMGYSLLRMQYFGFVVFLTIFLIISFYFLNPVGFKSLIEERLMDTLIGSFIAFLSARFIFPVWGQDQMKNAMRKMLEANRQFFLQAWMILRSTGSETTAYAIARQDAIVSLTNLADNFQRMLSEPQQAGQGTPIHQFVIANHMLTGHIAALSGEQLMHGQADSIELEELSKAILFELQCADDNLRDTHARTDIEGNPAPLAKQSLTQLSMIFALTHDIRMISARLSSLQF